MGGGWGLEGWGMMGCEGMGWGGGGGCSSSGCLTENKWMKSMSLLTASVWFPCPCFMIACQKITKTDSLNTT